MDGKTAAEVAAAPDSPLLFFRHRLIGVSTVVGNQTLAKTTLNALKVLALAGAAETVPVVQGQNRPLLRQAADICPGPSIGFETSFLLFLFSSLFVLFPCRRVQG